MIVIEKLNKVYRSRKRKKHHALKDVSVALPDAGLVFVLGKSGSGKSTLLNLIGGLDSITSGKIRVDGNDISSLSESEYANYRNSHIGFVFQDYHLIDELTVFENVNIALSLGGRRAEDKVKEALARVGLSGYENRFPTELSGGEQQRVAIARAIVKSPRIILADEPTGNLDTNTATQIINILKKLSKECLILIVSHNINDANKYADRIIELSSGRIINDCSRNPDFADEVTVSGDTLVYPRGAELSDKDIELINSNPQKRLVKNENKFLATKSPVDDLKKRKIAKKGIRLCDALSLSGKFLKNKAAAISLSAFMVAVIMVIMALAQTIINFNASEILATEVAKSEHSSMLIRKVISEEKLEQLGKEYPIKVSTDDIREFYYTGYSGKIYPVYSHTITIANGGTYWGTNSNHFRNSIIMTETLGTMVVDEEFLTNKFGTIELLAEAEVQTRYGVYITDYVADCILELNQKYKNGSYEGLVGGYYYSNYFSPRMYINGIIKTDYKEKYEDAINDVKSGKIDSTKVFETKELQSLMDEIYATLGFCYTTNPNFIDDLLESPLGSYPAHYKLNVNGALDYLKTSGTTYVIGYDFKTIPTLANNLASSWCFYNEAPEIPEGARYIRVSFNDEIDTRYKVVNEMTTLECAILRFDGGEPISKEIMNFNTATEEEGIHLNGYTGEIQTSTQGKKNTYVSDYIEIPDGATITELVSIAHCDNKHSNAYYVFYDENKKPITSKPTYAGVGIEDGTIQMNFDMYNALFGTSYNSSNLDTFVPHKITLTQYENSDINNENPLFEPREVLITNLFTGTYDLIVNEDLFKQFKKDFVRPYFLYFDGTEDVGGVLDSMEKLGFQPNSYVLEGIKTMTRAVDVFIPIFEMIAIVLCIGVVFILVNFASKTINDKMHEIGILKALGSKNGSIGIVFGLQVALIALLTCILMTVGYYLFIDLANEVLIESLKKLAPFRVVMDLKFLTFQPSIAVRNSLLILALALVSTIVPFIKIRFVKPVKIINSRD